MDFWEAMNMTVGILSSRKETQSRMGSGPSKTKIDYCLVRGDERNFVKDMDFLPSESWESCLSGQM